MSAVIEIVVSDELGKVRLAEIILREADKASKKDERQRVLADRIYARRLRELQEFLEVPTSPEKGGP